MLAAKLRSFDTESSSKDGNKRFFDSWIATPIRKTLVESCLFIVTCLAVLLAPKVLYADAPETSDPFQDERTFVLAAIAFYELIGGQFVYLSPIDNIKTPVIKTLTQIAASAISLLVFVSIYALLVWMTARRAKATIKFQQSIRIACYSMGIVPMMQVLTLIPIMGAVKLTYPLHSNFGIFWGFNFAFQMLVSILSALVLVHLTFIIPVSLFSPNASKLSLWRCWWVYWIFTVLVGIVLNVAYFLYVFLRSDFRFKIGFN